MTECRSGQARETGAGEKESGLCKCRPPENMEGSCPGAHLHASVQAEVFTRTERGTEPGDQGRGWPRSLGAEEYRRELQNWPSDGLGYVILVLWLKVSKSPRAGMPEGQSLYLLKVVPRILYKPAIYL